MAKVFLCLALCAISQVVVGQWSSTTQSTTPGQSGTNKMGASGSFGSDAWGSSSKQSAVGHLGTDSWGPVGSNESNNLANQAPVTQFLAQVLRGEMFGLKKCKKPKDCGLGLRCDMLMNLCVPLSTPILSDIEKTCSNDSECSGMHACQGGLCRFCGPKSCRGNQDCCLGSFASGGQSGKFFECLNIEDLENLAVAKQLGKVPQNYQPLPKSAGGKSEEYEVESDELMQLGWMPYRNNAFHGKRCWGRCNVDNDCYTSQTLANDKQQLGCCNGVCTKKSSCVSVPQNVVQQHQQMQQQKLQQQQMFNQQQSQMAAAQQLQALQQQAQQQLAGQAHSRPGQWGAGGHHLGQPIQSGWNAQPQVVVASVQPIPATWEQAQQQKPSWQG